MSIIKSTSLHNRRKWLCNYNYRKYMQIVAEIALMRDKVRDFSKIFEKSGGRGGFGDGMGCSMGLMVG